MNLELIEHYIGQISELFSVRKHSEGRVTVSGYIGDKHILLEGHYDVVMMCVKSLYWEFKE